MSILVRAEGDAAPVEPFLGQFWWNYILASFASMKFNGCTYYGLWGLVWYNDGGELMDACFKIGLNGSLFTFEVDA
jgi:hypothetical protein